MGRQDLTDAFLKRDERHVTSATAKIEHKDDLLVNVMIFATEGFSIEPDLVVQPVG